MSFNAPSPPALILANNDLSPVIKNTLTSQLEISETISLDEFNARIAVDPNYPAIVHLNNLRILVTGNLFDHSNRNLFDVVLFIKAGLVSVEKCSGNGPPGKTYQVGNIYLNELIKHDKGCCQWCSFVPGCCPDFIPFWLGIGNSNILPSTCVDPFKAHILDMPAQFPYGTSNSGYPINNGLNCQDQAAIAPSICKSCITPPVDIVATPSSDLVIVTPSYAHVVILSQENGSNGNGNGNDNESSGNNESNETHVTTSIYKISPDIGDPLGGGLHRIYGVGLSAIEQVLIGNIACQTISVIDDGTIDIITPALAYSSVKYDISVQTHDGYTTISNAYESWSPLNATSAQVTLWDAENISDMTLSGTHVSQWNDRGGSGKNWIQPTDANKPVLVNNAFQGAIRGASAVRFSPSSASFMTQTKTVLSSGYTIAFGGRTKSTTAINQSTTGSVAMPVIGDDYGDNWGAVGLSLGAVMVSNGEGTWTYDTLGDISNANWLPHVWAVSHDAFTTKISAWTDNTPYVYSPSRGYNTSHTGYSCLGTTSGSHSDFFDGDLAFIIVVNGILSYDDRAKLQKWAQSRYWNGSYAWEQKLAGGGPSHNLQTEAPWITATGTGRDGAALVNLNNTLALCFGWNGTAQSEWNNKYTNNEVWQAVDDGKSWIKLLNNDDTLVSGSTRPRRRHGFAHCIHKSTIDGSVYWYVVGGDMWDDISGTGGGLGIYNHYPQDVWRTKDFINWQLVNNATPWPQVVLGNVFSLSGTLYAVGGQTNYSDPSTATSLIYKSTDDGVTWVALSTPPWPTRSFGSPQCVLFNNAIYMVGGFRYNNSGSYDYLNDVWKFDGTTWVQVTANAPWAGKAYMPVVVFDNKLWAICGYSAGANTNEVWFSSDGSTWQRLTDIPILPSHADGVCVTPDNSIMRSGGNYSTLSGQCDAWAMSMLISQ